MTLLVRAAEAPLRTATAPPTIGHQDRHVRPSPGRPVTERGGTGGVARTLRTGAQPELPESAGVHIRRPTGTRCDWTGPADLAHRTPIHPVVHISGTAHVAARPWAHGASDGTPFTHVSPATICSFVPAGRRTVDRDDR